MAFFPTPSILVIMALRGIDSVQAVGSIDDLEQVDEVLAKLKELKSLLQRRRMELAVRMEDLVVPVRRPQGQAWLKEEQFMQDCGCTSTSHKAAFCVGPGRAEVVCSVDSCDSCGGAACDFRAELRLQHGDLLWQVGFDEDPRERPDLDTALQLLEASQVCCWTTPALLRNKKHKSRNQRRRSKRKPDERPASGLPFSAAPDAPDEASPHLHIWPIVPAAGAASPAAAAAAEARRRRVLVRRFLADVSAEALEQMCRHGLLGDSLGSCGTSVRLIERWIVLGDSWSDFVRW